MNPEVTKLLSDLGSKMGTTIEYLWPKLVGHAQAEATAWFWVFIIAGSLFALVALANLLWAIFGKGEEGSFFACVIATLFALGSFLGSATQYADKRFPEAVAIRTITGR